MPTTYYIAVEYAIKGVTGFPSPLKLLTVIPSFLQYGKIRIPNREYGLVVGQSAEFQFFTSTTRIGDKPGDLIDLESVSSDLFEEMLPLEINFQFGKRGGESEVVPVSFEAAITKTGMFRLWCVARSGQRWKMELNVEAHTKQKVRRIGM